MNAALSAQARAQIEQDAEAVRVGVEGGSPVVGLFSKSPAATPQQGGALIGLEQPTLLLHIDAAASMEAKQTILTVDSTRYAVLRIQRLPELYRAELQLGPPR